MSAENERFVVFRKGPGDAEVARVSRNEDGTWAEESRHKIVNNVCDCKAFEFHRSCAHFDAASEHGKSVSLDEARKVAGEVIAVLGDGVSLPDEPYERGPDGSVVRVHVRMKASVTKGSRVRALWKGVEVLVDTVPSFGGR